MARKMIAALSIILGCFMLFSCGQNHVAKNIDTNDSATNAPILKDTANNIPLDGFNTIFSYTDDANETIRIFTTPPSGNNYYFLSDTLNYIIAANYQNAQLVQSDTLLINEWAYTSIDSSTIQQKNIDGENYVFLNVGEGYMGQTILEKTASFFAVNVSNLNSVALVYEGKSSLR